MINLNTLPASILSLNATDTAQPNDLGNEAISFTTLRDHFSKVNKQALGILGYFTNTDEFKIVSLRARDLNINAHVRSAGYMALRGVEVYKPSAFVGNIDKFIMLLDSVAPDIQTLNSAITDFESTLARMVHEPDLLTKPNTGIKGIKLPSGSKTLEKFGDFFMGKSGIDVTKLDKIYPNLSSMDHISDVLLRLTETFNGNDVATVRTCGDSLYKTLEYLEDELLEQGLEMTPKWRKSIGEELYRLTEWLGIYSLFITKLVAVSISHRDTVTKLNNM